MFLINPYILKASSVLDADAQAFITTASITDPTQQSAINQLVLDLKSASVWAKLDTIYPFVGGNATAHSYNLKDTSTYQITWNGGMTHNSNGITGNATNAYGTNGWIASSNFSIGAYLVESANTSFMSHIGTYNGTGQLSMMSQVTNASLTSDVFNQNSTTFSYMPSTNHSRPFNGIMSMGRTTSTDVHARILGVSYTDTKTLDTQTLSPAILARQNSANVTLFSDFNIRLIYQGALTLSEEITVETIVNDFQTTLSRNV